MASVSSSGVYPDAGLEPDDLIYHCKRCGEILEEGKAFELAGHRWHIDCFRCNTCNTLLDSDANLLLLGDGSLICNGCTYCCNACGSKIEDLAILTGDQAFCASCFRCRNCKRKIENLRYARTSQGIFCMSCHESVMARRRKKAKASSRSGASTTSITASLNQPEKALPSLPPGISMNGAAIPDADAQAQDVPIELAADAPASDRVAAQSRARRDASSPAIEREHSPLIDPLSKSAQTLPASTYAGRRPSMATDAPNDHEEQGYLPVAFDPSAVKSSGSISRKQVPRRADSSPSFNDENKQPRDYFAKSSSRTTRESSRDQLQGVPSELGERERDSDQRYSTLKPSGAHIAYQEIGRSKKRDTSIASTSDVTTPGLDERPSEREVSQSNPSLGARSPATIGDEADKAALSQSPSRATKSGALARSDSRISAQVASERSEHETNPRFADLQSNAGPDQGDQLRSGLNPSNDSKAKDVSEQSAETSQLVQDDAVKHQGPRSPITIQVDSPKLGSTRKSGHERNTSASSSIRASLTDLMLGVSRKSTDVPPPRAPGRVASTSGRSLTGSDSGLVKSPTAVQSSTPKHFQHDSISTLQSSDGRSTPAYRSTTLPTHNIDAPFSMEEEMARILRGDDKRDNAPAEPTTRETVLRRVSNSVKHGRSLSERGVSSSINALESNDTSAIDASAPFPVNLAQATDAQQGTLDQLRGQLKRASKRIAELEAEKSGLQYQVDSSAEIAAASDELREKRNTMVVLDTQRELIVAELESMTTHLQRAKDSGTPLDLQALKSEVSRDFADALQRIKHNMTRQIEDLMHRRNMLTEEIGTLIQMKDKGFQEYESLSSKNAQLAEHNAQLVQSIQGGYKTNTNGKPLGSAANGLGIQHGNFRSDSNGSLPEEMDPESGTMISSPQVVNMRKGQPKKFNWRKGGEKMAKNVTKGIKGAFAGDKVAGTPYGDIGLPYNFTQVATASDHGSLNSRTPIDPKAGGFGFFGQKNSGSKISPATHSARSNSISNLLSANASVLFGSELEARCDYERRLVPSVITRCIEEVESRGMDTEGIYRKSGGSGQVKSVQQGFEKDSKFDVSDPDLDIHAVTSTLKQYFRKLPMPLITYDSYDTLLEAGQIQDTEKQIIALQAAIAELPDSHRNCLEYLIQHLTRVVAHESQNLMTPLNISVVFAPTIMRPSSIEREMSDMQMQRQAVQALLAHHEAIFNSGD